MITATPVRNCAVYLVSPTVWEPLTQRALASVQGSMRGFAKAVLSLAHSRHLGLPPELVVRLVSLLLSPRYLESQENPWTPCFKRLQRELAHKDGMDARETHHALLLQAHPAWFVLSVALPLATKVLRELGTCYLFCEEPVQTGVEHSHYQHYLNQFTQLLRDIPGRPDQYALFWQERALTLAGLSRNHRGGAAVSHSWSICPAFAMLVRVRASVQEDPSLRRRLRQVSARHKQRPVRRFREGGFNGIQLTRRPEDLDGILLSEFINPDFLLTDRLLNTGYFALERSPKRESLRDVYIVGMLPGSLAGTLQGSLIKACWFEALARLGHLLRQAGLGGSCFSWLEGDRHGRLYASTFQLDQLPSFVQVQDGQMGEAWRREFLTALGWVPHFLYPTEQAPLIQVGADQGQTPELQWLIDAWRFYQEEGSGQDSRRPRASRFSFLHLMAILPQDAKTPSLPSYASASQLLGFNGKSGRYLSLTGVPRDLKDPNSWRFLGFGKEQRALFPYEPPEHERAIVSTLVSTWTHQLLGEIWRD